MRGSAPSSAPPVLQGNSKGFRDDPSGPRGYMGQAPSGTRVLHPPWPSGGRRIVRSKWRLRRFSRDNHGLAADRRCAGTQETSSWEDATSHLTRPRTRQGGRARPARPRGSPTALAALEHLRSVTRHPRLRRNSDYHDPAREEYAKTPAPRRKTPGTRAWPPVGADRKALESWPRPFGEPVPRIPTARTDVPAHRSSFRPQCLHVGQIVSLLLSRDLEAA